MFLVLVDTDGGKFVVSDAATINVTEPVLADGGTFVWPEIYPGDPSGWQTIGSAPEPTSGLLLLIGVAGLALKRRRA